MKVLSFVFAFILSQAAWGVDICDPKSKAFSGAQAMERLACEKTKASAKCQELYQQIKENGQDPGEKALRCDVDTSLTRTEALAVSYISCLKGGVVDGILTPLQDMGKWLGESAAKAVEDFRKNRERLAYCDKNPEMKKELYRSFNKGVPKLLQIQASSGFENKSCAQLETDIYHQSKLRAREIAKKTDHKNFQKNANLSEDEKNYLSWKFKSPGMADSSDKGLKDYADEILESYNIRSECYNLPSRSALRCEALFSVASVGAGFGGAGLSALSGLKAERFAKAAQATTQAAGGLKNMSAAQKTSLMLKADKLTDSQRLQASSRLLNRDLSSEQKNALLEAHRVGAGKGERAYSKVELKQKADLLKKAGFSSQERDTLMRTGITGEFDDYLKVAAQAQQRELEAQAQLTKIDRQRAEASSKLRKKDLSDGEKTKLEEELKKLDDEAQEVRSQYLFGDVIGVGNGPADLNRIERRVGFTSREIDIAEANGEKVTPLLEKRAKYMNDLGEFQAMGKDYTGAAKTFSVAAKDIEKAVESGGLANFQEKLNALRTLESAGAEKYRETYERLLEEVVDSPQVKNRAVNLQTVPFKEATANPVVLQQQGDAWKLAREYKEQKVRIEIQRRYNEKRLGSNWESQARASREFDQMVETRDRLRRSIETQLKKEYGTSGASKLQKVYQDLGLD